MHKPTHRARAGTIRQVGALNRRLGFEPGIAPLSPSACAARVADASAVLARVGAANPNSGAALPAACHDLGSGPLSPEAALCGQLVANLDAARASLQPGARGPPSPEALRAAEAATAADCELLPYAFNASMDCRTAEKLPSVEFVIGGVPYSLPPRQYAAMVCFLLLLVVPLLMGAGISLWRERKKRGTRLWDLPAECTPHHPTLSDQCSFHRPSCVPRSSPLPHAQGPGGRCFSLIQALGNLPAGFWVLGDALMHLHYTIFEVDGGSGGNGGNGGAGGGGSGAGGGGPRVGIAALAPAEAARAEELDALLAAPAAALGTSRAAARDCGGGRAAAAVAVAVALASVLMLR